MSRVWKEWNEERSRRRSWGCLVCVFRLFKQNFIYFYAPFLFIRIFMNILNTCIKSYVFVCHKNSEEKKGGGFGMWIIEPSLSLTRKPNKAICTHTGHTPVNTRLSPREQNRKNEENRPCPRWNIPQEYTIASNKAIKSYFIYFIIIFYKITNISSFILAFNTIK